MQISDFFPQNSSRESLLKVQRIVSEKAVTRDNFGEISRIGAADQAFLKERIISGILILDFASLKVIESAFSIMAISFP